MTNSSFYIKRHIRLLAVLIAGLLYGLPQNGYNKVHAQSNPYKINDNIYSYWQTRIAPDIQKQGVLARIDTMFTMGQKQNDLKAQCIAKTLYCRHYYYVNDLTHLKESLQQCQNFCVKTPFQQYCFDPWNLLVTLYTLKDINQGIDECHKYQKMAYELNNPYGIVYSHKRLADLYHTLFLYRRSIEELQKGILKAKELHYEKELPSLYAALGRSYSYTAEYKKAVGYLQMANRQKNSFGQNEAFSQECHLLFAYSKLKEHPDSIAYFLNATNQRMKKNNYRSRLTKNNYYRALCAYYEYKNEPQTILFYADSTGTTNEWKTIAYQMEGDCDKAISSYAKMFNDLKNRMESESQSHLNSLAMANNVLQLEQDKNALALKNTQMQLQHASDQVRISNAEIEQNKLALKNSALELKNQQTETEKAKAVLAKEHEQRLREADHAKLMDQKYNLQMLQIILLAVLFLVICVIFIAYYIRRKIERKRLLHEKRIAEEACARAEEACTRAENADRLKSIFLQNMSHEIRTPLNAIVGFTELLNNNDMPLEDAERQEFKELVRTNSDLLTGLINDILDLSKLETNNYKLSLSPVPVADVCKDALNSVSHRAQEGVKLILDLPKSAEERKLELQTDRLRLNQVLINFLTNACKYTEKGSITLAYRLNGDHVVFSVTDTGTGIPKEKAEEVFNRFEKLDEFKQGTGLGLNICQHITQLVHGKIYVDTSYTQGARFVFEHPLHIEQ